MASSQDKVQHYLGQLDREVCTEDNGHEGRPPAGSELQLAAGSLVPSRQLHVRLHSNSH